MFDISSGWGGLAFYLAEICSADVTGATLSKTQVLRANGQARASWFGSRVEFHADDYRDVKGAFDRIVAIKIIENIGVGSADTFFRNCADLTTEDGVILLQSSIRREGLEITNPFISKYIFPGSHIPALSEILPAIERAGLLVTDIEHLQLHYAETLKVWRERFLAHREDIEKLHDERWRGNIGGRRGGIPNSDDKSSGVVPFSRDCIALEGASTKCKKRAASSLSELQANSVDEDPLPMPNRCCGGIFPPFEGRQIEHKISDRMALNNSPLLLTKPAI